jgi:dihydroflavonol-4-reductase
MKALVTGGAGFLGQKVSAALLEAGHEVRWLVRQPGPRLHPGVSYVVGDLADEASLRRACDGMDWVIHTAGLISYNPAKADLMYRTNVLGTRAVAEAALASGVRRFLHVSSTAAIGVSEDPLHPMDESTPFNARSLGLAYFDTKFDAELAALEVGARGLEVVIVNPGSLLGPGDTRRYEKGYVGLIYQYRPPVLFHGGINFVDVADVVSGMLAALDRGRAGERYILGGENLSFGDMIVRVNTILGRPSPSYTVPKGMMGALAQALRVLNWVGVDLHMTPELVRQVSSWYLYVSSAKAEKELGYRPRRIDHAVVGTVDWLKAEGRLR